MLFVEAYKSIDGHDISNDSAVFTDKDNNTLMDTKQGNGNNGIALINRNDTKLHVKAGTNINFEFQNRRHLTTLCS